MSILEEFNERILSKTRDDVIDREIGIVDGKGSGVINNKLSEWISILPGNHKELMKKMIIDTVDATLHELLCNLDENIRFKLVAYDGDNVINMSEEHEENLVGSFLDSIDTYGKYNSAYDIISKDAKLEKEIQ